MKIGIGKRLLRLRYRPQDVSPVDPTDAPVEGEEEVLPEEETPRPVRRQERKRGRGIRPSPRKRR